MNNQDILFAGLMGVKAVKTLERLDIVQNELTKHVFPPIPFLPFRNITGVQEVSIGAQSNIWKADHQVTQRNLWEADPEQSEDHQFFPLSFSFFESGTKWLFPYEPLISISGGSNIVKRNVAKNGTDERGKQLTGTIKERWSQKDFDITITGVLMGKKLRGKPEDCYPKAQMNSLFEFLTAQKEIYVFCHLFEPLGINRIVIEDYSFPFTKGENVQAYEIKAVSDSIHKLLIEV